MAESHRRRYSRSPSPPKARSRSLSRSISKSRSPSPPRFKSRSRSRSRSASRGREEVSNPGNTLFVTGLSARVTERDLRDHFGKEGKSRRKRPRTPTPGHYLGLDKSRETGHRGRPRGGYGREDYGHRRSPRRSPYRGGRGYSPRRSPYAERSRRYRSRSYSPYGSPDRGYGRRSGYVR